MNPIHLEVLSFNFYLCKLRHRKKVLENFRNLISQELYIEIKKYDLYENPYYKFTRQLSFMFFSKIKMVFFPKKFNLAQSFKTED